MTPGRLLYWLTFVQGGLMRHHSLTRLSAVSSGISWTTQWGKSSTHILQWIQHNIILCHRSGQQGHTNFDRVTALKQQLFSKWTTENNWVKDPTCFWHWCRTWCSDWRTWEWVGYSWRTPGAGRQSQTVGEEEVWNNEKSAKQQGLEMFQDILWWVKRHFWLWCRLGNMGGGGDPYLKKQNSKGKKLILHLIILCEWLVYSVGKRSRTRGFLFSSSSCNKSIWSMKMTEN